MRIWSSEIVNKIGEEVELAGWVGARRDHGKLIFIDLRDRSGLSQLVFNPQNLEPEQYKIAESLRPEWVIEIKGTVKQRPKGMENKELATGKIEIEVNIILGWSPSKTPPFDISGEGYDVNEEIRMKYRYLDLRRKRLFKNIKQRAQVFKFIRDFLFEKNFIEVETPALGKSTPEGARDYIVPVRLAPGKFYALPQSPQQYKQLLMVAGMERYFQIARCFRDEDTRGDRQPEFTQLDLEMSFINEGDVLELIEELFTKLVKEIYPHKKIQKHPFPRISYKEATAKYNSDKPDLRKDQRNQDELAFVSITDFPMFEWKETEKRWDVVHHPFTMPKVDGVADFVKKFEENPAKLIAKQYDLILNGYEIGSGSIRINNPELLQCVFQVLGNTPEDIQDKFGHILEAFKYGVPPHGGIALGLDRLVMILQNEPNIREIITFPKTGDGKDLMMGAPAEVEKGKLKELHIKVEKK